MGPQATVVSGRRLSYYQGGGGGGRRGEEEEEEGEEEEEEKEEEGGGGGGRGRRWRTPLPFLALSLDRVHARSLALSARRVMFLIHDTSSWRGRSSTYHDTISEDMTSEV